MTKLGNRWTAWNESLPVRIFSSLAAFCWFGVPILWTQYDFTRPTSPVPSEGRTYELETHGHAVFLTQTELSRLYILGIAGAIFLIVAIAVKSSQSERN